MIDDEISEALRAAREKKHYLIKRIEYAEELRRKSNPARFSAEMVFNTFCTYWDVDDRNQIAVENLCYYFTEDERFQGDAKKGLLIYGDIGIGKTTLMHFFRKNQKGSYRVLSCRDIESDFSSEGEKSVRNCSYNITIPENIFCQKEIGFCFDDMGTEANAKHYGKEKNVMAEIILNRYDNQIPFYMTHITTNLTVAELEAQYGNRVTDRMKEMFNIITFDKNAKSRRK